MEHHWLLITVFLILTLVVPAVIAVRVFSTAFSGLRPGSFAEQEDAAGDALKSDQAPAQQQDAIADK